MVDRFEIFSLVLVYFVQGCISFYKERFTSTIKHMDSMSSDKWIQNQLHTDIEEQLSSRIIGLYLFVEGCRITQQ
jgi:hypothetical protein